MKKHFLHLLFIFFCVSLSSQTPQKFTYQSVVRSSDGNVLKSANIGIRFSILQNSNIGKTVYRERHSTETNSNGMISLSIGDGTTSDNFSAIDWSTGEYFLRIEVDPLGGSNYLIQSTSQLLSVPYALYAGSSNTNLLLSGENYLTYSNNELRLKKINLSTNTNGVLPVNSGGTGVNTAPMISLIKAADAAGAREILGVESSSDEDNSTPVTLTTVTGNYLTIDGQEITAGIVPISLGGTGVNSTPMIGVITASNAAAARTALGAGTIATQNNTAVNIDGGSIDGTPVGGTLKSTGAFTIVSSAIYQSNDNTDLTLKTGSAVTGNITIANGANGNINISPDGTGQVVIDNLKFPNSFGNSNQVLKTNGSGTLSWADEADGSTAVTLATVTDNYLAISEQTITAGTVPISLGGTGSTTAPMIGLVTAENAAAARNALGVDASGTDGSTAVTLATVTDNYLAISGQAITAGTVPISLGGTGSATAPMIGLVTAADAAAARTALGVDASGTDGSTAVTLATVTDNYLAIVDKRLQQARFLFPLVEQVQLLLQ